MKKKVSDKELLSIGAVARSFGVSENCIRRMEAAGLIRPAYVAAESGYRYYSGSDFAQIGTVLTLRSFGFTSEDISLFVKNPDDLAVLYCKLEDIRQTVTNLMLQLNRRMKDDAPYRCDVISFSEMFCYTWEVATVPHLSVFSDIASEMLLEAIRNRFPIDYIRPLMIETASTDFSSFDPAAEQKLLFHIPLREAVQDRHVTFVPQTRALDVKWSYPGTDYSGIIPVIRQYLEISSLRQAGTLRATFDVGNFSSRNADVSNTVMHILIPVG